MDHKALLEHCVTVLDFYKSDTQSIEDHVNRYLKQNGVSVQFPFIESK